MDREEMLDLLRTPPVRIAMNDGTTHIVGPENQPSCGTLSLVFLQLYDDDVYRHVHLPYVTMTEVVTDAPTM